MSRIPADGRRSGAVLHLRGRRAGWVVIGVLVLAAVSWWSAGWLASRTYFDGPLARPPVAVLAPLVAAVMVSATLAGGDIELDRTAARLTATHRAAHALVAAVTVAAVLGAVATDTPETFGSYALIRNSLGLIGLVLLAAAFLSAGLAWAPALTYSVVVYLAAPRTPRAGSSWWAWPMQRGGPDPSWLVAVALLAAGVTAYAWRGPRGADDRAR